MCETNFDDWVIFCSDGFRGKEEYLNDIQDRGIDGEVQQRAWENGRKVRCPNCMGMHKPMSQEMKTLMLTKENIEEEIRKRGY